jgi:hypothetical protein
MKRILAGLLTAALMGLLLWSGSRRSSAPAGPGAGQSEAAHPAEARVAALLETTTKGDVPAYLDSFGGPLRERLAREVEERGRDAFAADLRRSAQARKSHAIFAAEPDGDDVARVAVETVYPDRNERQTYRVDRGQGGWLVTEVETVRSVQPKAKFGATASYQEPEGNPLQAMGVVVETGDDVPGATDPQIENPNP